VKALELAGYEISGGDEAMAAASAAFVGGLQIETVRSVSMGCLMTALVAAVFGAAVNSQQFALASSVIAVCSAVILAD
jgi:hypothetical protein